MSYVLALLRLVTFSVKQTLLPLNKLPFDIEVAEKVLNGIQYVCSK
jgi:hypothetical protein